MDTSVAGGPRYRSGAKVPHAEDHCPDPMTFGLVWLRTAGLAATPGLRWTWLCPDMAADLTVAVPAVRSIVVDHHHRAFGVLNEPVAGRTEQQPTEAAATATAHDEQLRGL